MRGAVVVSFSFAMASCLPSVDEFASGTPDAGTHDSGATHGTTTTTPPDAGAALPHSCKDVLASKPGADNGIYTTTNGDLYCDLTTDGGGWTLVGRSNGNDNADQNVPFGWHGTTGSVQDDNHPYSLNVLDLDFDFSEVLLGNVDDGKTLGAPVYKVPVSKAFLVANADTTTGVVAATVEGKCAPDNGPTMLSHWGFSSAPGQFHFRDVGASDDDPSQQYGLLWYGFELRYNNCQQGANLNQDTGELFVR